MYNCNLCCKELNGSSYDVRKSSTKPSDIYLISILENVIGQTESLETISDICKDCYNLLLEFHILSGRMVQIKNIVHKYVEDKQKMLIYLNKNNEEQIDCIQQDSGQELQLFEEIIEINCHNEKDEIVDNKKESNEHEIDNKIEPELKYKCNCGKDFDVEVELTKCKNSHSNSQPFVCELCGQSYKQKRGFAIHMKIHAGLNPYTCVYCNKSFTQKIALMRHIPLHTGMFDFIYYNFYNNNNNLLVSIYHLGKYKL